MVEESSGDHQTSQMRSPGLRWAAEPPHHPRDYQCRSCSRSEQGSHVPAGWYTIHRALGGHAKQRRLGLYCTLACLIKAHRQLQEGAAEHAEYLGLPANDRAVLDSLFEEAHRHIVGDGLSLRDTGNLLRIPTGVLRDWFRSAGISLTEAAPVETAKQAGTESIADFLAGKRHPSAVSVLGELKDAGHLTAIDWTYTMTGPAHQPTFTCTVTITRSVGHNITLRAQGSKKPAAKSAAAEQMIIRLLEEAYAQDGGAA